MAIQALPQTTVRAIGASQVLTDPAALVKELVDNALDAQATSVAVEIHANTLDLIQVRDNGHGIPPQDRPLVARRYCTSKLINADDLSSIRGSSLGFRGEALASAAEMSDGMTVTTRVEGEQVATALQIDQQGEITGQNRASTAVGTTVKITEFIKSNPVRRQVALKHVDHCLKRIKHLLQAFAFARPHVRLSLKILKAKNEKGNWIYAPKAGGNVEDASIKIVGAACASQCTAFALEDFGVSMEALLPQPDSVPEKISNHGAYVSIDHRPVNGQRGISKQIVKAFRQALKSINARFEGVQDPFMYLEIVCVGQAYDPNIEPAKDDVLFEEPDKIIELARKLFAMAYPSPGKLQSPDPTRQEPVLAASSRIGRILHEEDFVTSLEKPDAFNPPGTTILRSPIRNPEASRADGLQDHVMGDQEPATPLQQNFRANMYGCDEEDIELINARPATSHTEADFQELREARKDVTLSNPWVMAKMNASNRQPQRIQPGESPVLAKSPSRGSAEQDSGLGGASFALPTPCASSPTSCERPFNPSNHVPGLRLANDGRVVDIQSSSQGLPRDTTSHTVVECGLMAPPRSTQERLPTACDYEVTPTSSLHEQQGTPLSAIPSAKGRGKIHVINRGQVNRPFISPVVDGPPKEKVWFDHLEGIDERARQRPRRRNDLTGFAGLVQQGEMDEAPPLLTPPQRNRDIRDFVASVDRTGPSENSPYTRGNNHENLQVATNSDSNHTPAINDETVSNTYGALSGRGFVPASELAALEAHIGSVNKPMAPPPKRSKTGDRALRQISGNATTTRGKHDGDQEYRPETTSGRRSSNKVQRTKSSRLPLERVPAGKATHHLAAALSMTTDGISAQQDRIDTSRSLLEWNEPAVDPYDAFGEHHSQADVQAMSNKVYELLINKVSDGEMVQDLGDLVDNALRSHRNTMDADQRKVAPSQKMLELS